MFIQFTQYLIAFGFQHGQTHYDKDNTMKIKRALPTLSAFILLCAVQTGFAQSVTFHQKASEAIQPIAGNLALSIDIDVSGKVNDARVVRSSGSQKIDAEAVTWIRTQHLRPVTMNGDSIRFSAIKEINFSKSAPVQQIGLNR